MNFLEQRPPRYEELVARADFDWVSVLTDAGAGAYLTGRNGPCPFCGGTDRFAFSHRKVAWVCRHCTGGYAGCADFLMRFMGYTEFRQLADHVRRFYGCRAGAAMPSVLHPARGRGPKAQIDMKKASARMEALWDAAGAVAAGTPSTVTCACGFPACNPSRSRSDPCGARLLRCSGRTRRQAGLRRNVRCHACARLRCAEQMGPAVQDLADGQRVQGSRGAPKEDQCQPGFEQLCVSPGRTGS